MAKVTKKLVRSTNDKIFTGFFGGLGEYFGIDSTILRIVFVAIAIITGILPGTLFYILGSIITPKE